MNARILDAVNADVELHDDHSNFVFDHEMLISAATRLSTNRRDKWPSRQKAAEIFRNNAYGQTWDSAWYSDGSNMGFGICRRLNSIIYSSKRTVVTLTILVCHKVTGFARPVYTNIPISPMSDPTNRATQPDLNPSLITPFPFYRPEPSLVFEQLPHLRPSVMYIFGGKPHMCAPALRLDKMKHTGTGVGGSGGTTCGRVQETLLPDYGHLLPLEAVDECARVTVDWLVPEMKRWEAEESAFEKQWNEKSMVERSSLDKDWKRQIESSERNRGAKM